MSRASQPATSKLGAKSRALRHAIQSCVGLMPARPQKAAGRMIEPPVWRSTSRRAGDRARAG